MSGSGRPPSLPTPSVPGFNNGATQGPVPGLPVPQLPTQGAGQGVPMPGLPVPGLSQGANPAQVLTAPAQVLTGGR